MEYTNDKIKQLLAVRNATIEKYNREILNEIAKEKARYKFSWKRFSIMIGAVVFMVVAIELNKKIFPKTSIWSWEYYMNDRRDFYHRTLFGDENFLPPQNCQAETETRLLQVCC